jgi:hypothetical protein
MEEECNLLRPINFKFTEMRCSREEFMLDHDDLYFFFILASANGKNP